MPIPSPAPDLPPILDCSILLVNDRQAALEAQWAVLTEQGYRTLRAGGGAEALRILSRMDDIAVTIIDLSDAAGPALLNDLRARDGGTTEYLLVGDIAGRDENPHDPDVLTRPLDDARLITAVSDAYNIARMQRFRLAEQRSLEESLAEFKAQTQAAMARLIARAQRNTGVRAGAIPVLAEADDAGLAAFAGGELQRARLREKLFGAVALRHSGWMLLLVLAEAGPGGSELTIKSAAYSAGLPLSSALRTIGALAEAGLIARRDDTLDARRSFIALTAQGRAQFSQYAAALTRIRKDRPA